MRSTEREQFLADIITTAIEGGTNYWARVYSYCWDGLPPAQVEALIVPEDVIEEHPEPSMLTRTGGWLSEHGRMINVDLIARGIGRITRGDVGVRSDLMRSIQLGDRTNDAGEIDADGADVIVQAGLFGKVVYG